MQADIDARLDEMAMPANEVLARLGEQARADLSDFITVGGLLDWVKLRECGKSHLIKKYKMTKNALGQLITEIELYSAQAALIHLDKAHGGDDGKPLEQRLVIEMRGNVDSDDL
jgi:hypothetical protein